MATQAETAGSFGYSLAFFQQNPELQGLLSQATNENWSPDRFVASFRNTQWFRDNAESTRKYNALATGDPNTLRSMVQQTTAKINNMAAQMGALVPAAGGAEWLANQAIMQGWSDEQIKQMLVGGGFVKKDAQGHYQGNAGVLAMQFQQLASDYGVEIGDDTVGSWVNAGVQGIFTTDNAKAQLQLWAANRYPPFADRIKAGETMKQIADPYVQSQAKLLETNPESINFSKDPLIQQALVAKDKDGKPVAKTVWEFENDVRNDARWAKTQNAQDTTMQAANKILQQFGLAAS